MRNRRFQKDIQIQIGKPKQRETPMKSNTRHVDGGGGNPRVHGGLEDRDLLEEKQMRFEKNRRFKKDIQLQIDKPK